MRWVMSREVQRAEREHILWTMANNPADNATAGNTPLFYFTWTLSQAGTTIVATGQRIVAIAFT